MRRVRFDLSDTITWYESLTVDIHVWKRHAYCRITVTRHNTHANVLPLEDRQQLWDTRQEAAPMRRLHLHILQQLPGVVDEARCLLRMTLVQEGCGVIEHFQDVEAVYLLWGNALRHGKRQQALPHGGKIQIEYGECAVKIEQHRFKRW